MDRFFIETAIGLSFFLLFGARRIPKHVIRIGKRIAERRRTREQPEF